LREFYTPELNAYAFHVHDHPVLQLSLVLSWRPEAMEGFTSNICLGVKNEQRCFEKTAVKFAMVAASITDIAFSARCPL